MASAAFKPDPECWTIRFKYSRSTIFLHVLPETPFHKIKQALLNSIKALPSTAQIVAALGTIPTDPDDIVFGMPVDKTDLEQGWVSLFDEEDDEATNLAHEENLDEAELDSVLNRHPRGAGLKDGSVLAFKFAGRQDDDGDEWDVEIPRDIDQGAEDEDIKMDDKINGKNDEAAS